MDCSIAAKYQPVLACFSMQNQHRILQYLPYLNWLGMLMPASQC